MAEVSCFLEGVSRQPGWRAGFVGRVAGVPLSTDKWATLEGLEPAHQEAVARLGFEWGDLWRAEQVHGAELAVVPGRWGRIGGGADRRSADRGGVEAGRMVPGVDGLLTAATGVVLGIYVADCAAVYLADRRSGAMALLHSGKKGTELGIVPRAVARMEEEFGTDPADLEAVIGPCIRPPLYEADIAGEIVGQLGEAGVRAVTDSGICTGAAVDRYYSYRVEKGATGRMLALLGRVAEEGGRDAG